MTSDKAIIISGITAMVVILTSGWAVKRGIDANQWALAVAGAVAAIVTLVFGILYKQNLRDSDPPKGQ